MRIDSHQHFWKYEPVKDSWINGSMKVIRRDFLPKHLIKILEKNGVDGCVSVQADQSEAETNFLLDCAENNDIIKGVVGWVDLCSGSISERLEHFSMNPYFKGVRHIVQRENKDFVLREDFQNGISKLAPLGLTYDLLVFPNQLKNTIKLVDRFPNQMFVLDHIAKPLIKSGELADWEKNISELAKHSNVYCKLSGMVTEAYWKNWKREDFNPYLNTIFNAFDTERLMFGSDCPVCLLAGQYGQVLGLVESYIQELSQKEKESVMGANACGFYDLKAG